MKREYSKFTNNFVSKIWYRSTTWHFWWYFAFLIVFSFQKKKFLSLFFSLFITVFLHLMLQFLGTEFWELVSPKYLLFYKPDSHSCYVDTLFSNNYFLLLFSHLKLRTDYKWWDYTILIFLYFDKMCVFVLKFHSGLLSHVFCLKDDWTIYKLKIIKN